MRDVFGGLFLATAVIGGALLVTFGDPGLGFGLLVLPCASCLGALLLPTGRLLAGYCSAFLMGAAALYGHSLYTASSPYNPGSPGDAIGIALVVFAFAGVLLGAALNILARLALARWRAVRQGTADDAAG